MKTNKAAALAKFLDRKLQDTSGLSSLDPRLIELAVKNAKHTLQSSIIIFFFHHSIYSLPTSIVSSFTYFFILNYAL